MTVLHTVASLHPNVGGPARTVSATCSQLSEAGATVDLVSLRSPGETTLAPNQPGVTVTFASKSHWLRDAWAFWRALRDRIEARLPALVHDHGVWLPTNLVSAMEARRHGCPLVVTTRGMLEPWALAHRSTKKTLSWYAYQHWILRQASLLHATSKQEAETLRDLGLRTPIAVIPNGVFLPDQGKQHPNEGEGRQALFLSRLHPKKGLTTLIDAWARVRPDRWKLVVAGPAEGDYRREVEARVERHEIEGMVTFLGPVDDREKWNLYRKSDLFILPTFSENFGMVVAEALACGVPVITTTGAPWQVLEERSCGWWVKPTVDEIAEALQDAVQRSDRERLKMGTRGRALVEDQFSWAGVAESMIASYRWLLEDGPRPDFVRTD